MKADRYEPVIGIETHVQLATKSKLFCGCDNDSRTAGPNTNVCPVCLGFPGALPVLNAAAVQLALRAGQALHAYDDGRSFHTKFDRKNYFYPDSPMNYQITQFDEPIIGQGWVEFPLDDATKRVGITRAHLEADAGKLIHPPGADYSLVDLNRAGTPLLEIVSDPDMHSAAEAKAYAQELYHLMRYSSVSDADLYHGNLRFDVNVSLRPAGAKELGTRTESKNLNSFRAVAGVVEHEIQRQTELLTAGKRIVQETRGWDETNQQTVSQRAKEEAHDYRYFPEPDLPPLVITATMLDEAKKAMPGMMPNELRAELAAAGLNLSETETLINNPDLVMLFLASTKHPNDKATVRRIAQWLVNVVIALIAEGRGQAANLSPDRLQSLSQAVDGGELSSTSAKQVLAEFLQKPPDLSIKVSEAIAIAEQLKIVQVSDTAELEKIVDEVIAANPEPAKQYKAGEAKVLGFLVGQVMKASRGQANPPMVNAILKQKLGD